MIPEIFFAMWYGCASLCVGIDVQLLDCASGWTLGVQALRVPAGLMGVPVRRTICSGYMCARRVLADPVFSPVKRNQT